MPVHLTNKTKQSIKFYFNHTHRININPGKSIYLSDSEYSKLKSILETVRLKKKIIDDTLNVITSNTNRTLYFENIRLDPFKSIILPSSKITKTIASLRLNHTIKITTLSNDPVIPFFMTDLKSQIKDEITKFDFFND